VNTESKAVFINFDDFEPGAMVKECRCDGIQAKRRIRLFANIPVVTDVAVCDRCGEVWDGRIN
jgi:hypothetical protein